MATIEEISAAINLIDVKKEDLHKSFLQLQSQSPSSLNSSLKWADFDSYFTTLHSSLQRKFNLLQTLYPPSDTPTVLARPELKSFCENSDGLGLMRFIARPGNRLSLLAELPDAYRYAPDAAAMILDAITEFHSNGADLKRREYRSCKKNYVIMLEGLLRVRPDVTIELKNKAMEMAVQFNQKRVSGNDDEKFEHTVKFLLLVGAYGLLDRFSMDQLSDCFAIATKGRHVLDISRLMIPANNINDLIQKLISKGMHVAAVYYSIEFQKTDEFPPLRLLEERKLMSMKTVEEIRKKEKGVRQIGGIGKEVVTLKSIIKCVDDYKLEHPKDNMVDLVKELENHIEEIKGAAINKHKSDEGSRKQPAIPTVSKKPKINKVSKKPKVNKFHQAAVPTCKQNVVPHNQPNPQGSDLLPDNLGPYAGLIAGLFGLTQPNFGYSGNPIPAGVGPSFYPTQSHLPSFYNSNGGFGYQPSYYPE